MEYPDLMSVIYSLGQESNVTRIVGDTYEGIEWISEPSATKEEVETELERLVLEYQNTEYKRLRSMEYPPIGDQLDALYHAGIFPQEMADKLKAVKDKYPKTLPD